LYIFKYEEEQNTKLVKVFISQIYFKSSHLLQYRLFQSRFILITGKVSFRTNSRIKKEKVLLFTDNFDTKVKA